MDPDGREIGNYYDENGNYIGTDGINDNKNYIIASISSSQVCSPSNGVLLPDASTITQIEAVSNTAGQFNEVGGIIALDKNGNQMVVEAVPGTPADPSISSTAEINVWDPKIPSQLSQVSSSNALGTFHTHPSGTVTKGNTIYSFQQSPSSTDISNAFGTNRPLNNLVISDKVYIYNGMGTLATFPKYNFFSLGK